MAGTCQDLGKRLDIERSCDSSMLVSNQPYTKHLQAKIHHLGMTALIEFENWNIVVWTFRPTYSLVRNRVLLQLMVLTMSWHKNEVKLAMSCKMQVQQDQVS